MMPCVIPCRIHDCHAVLLHIVPDRRDRLAVPGAVVFPVRRTRSEAFRVTDKGHRLDTAGRRHLRRHCGDCFCVLWQQGQVDAGACE